MLGAILLNVLILFGTLFLILTLWLKKRYRYWEERGLVNPPVSFSKLISRLSQKISIADQQKELYNFFKQKNLKHGGTFLIYKPSYIALDPNIIKHIMQNDFQYFADRGVYFNEKTDPLSAHLFAIEGKKWKTLREKLSPTFTSGRMKMMFETLVHVSNGLVQVIDENLKDPIDIKDVLARFTTDIIGSCAFGIDCNSLNDPNTHFRTKGKKIFNVSAWTGIKNFLSFISPNVGRALGVVITPPDVTEFFTKVVDDTVEYREKNNIYRKDFMHMLIQLKNRGRLVDDGKLFLQEGEKIGPDVINIKELAAQAFVFFLAGFETSSTVMTFALYELAVNKDIQEKLRQEVVQVLEKHGQKLTYEAVQEMHYMDNVLNESLRKYPPVPNLIRACGEDYKVPGTDFTLAKGTSVNIPIYGIQHDEKYYPDPEKFNPDHFTEENKKSRPPFTFLPFGEGPRHCIGLRFGLMQSKVGLAVILKNYEIGLSNKTVTPIVMDPSSFILCTKGGVWLDMKKIN